MFTITYCHTFSSFSLRRKNFLLEYIYISFRIYLEYFSFRSLSEGFFLFLWRSKDYYLFSSVDSSSRSQSQYRKTFVYVRRKKNYLTIRAIFRNPIWLPSTSCKTFVGTWCSSRTHDLISTLLPNQSIFAKTTDFHITIPHKYMLKWRRGGETTTLCPIKRNRSLGLRVVKWTASGIPFGTFIVPHVQDLEIPEARGKIFQRKPIPATLHGKCGYISVMKIREWSLFFNGNGVIPGLLTHCAQRVFKAFLLEPAGFGEKLWAGKTALCPEHAVCLNTEANCSICACQGLQGASPVAHNPVH